MRWSKHPGDISKDALSAYLDLYPWASSRKTETTGVKDVKGGHSRTNHAKGRKTSCPFSLFQWIVKVAELHDSAEFHLQGAAIAHLNAKQVRIANGWFFSGLLPEPASQTWVFANPTTTLSIVTQTQKPDAQGLTLKISKEF